MPFEHVALGVCWNSRAAKAFPRSISCAPRQVCERDRNAQCSTRIERLDDLAAEIAQIVIDDRDGKLRRIWFR